MDLIARSSYGSGDWASFQLKVMVKAQNKRIDWLKIFHKMFLKAEAAGDSGHWWHEQGLNRRVVQKKNETLGQRMAEPTRQSWSWKHLINNLGKWWKLLETAGNWWGLSKCWTFLAVWKQEQLFPGKMGMCSLVTKGQCCRKITPCWKPGGSGEKIIIEVGHFEPN